jgi:hypothetical protein
MNSSLLEVVGWILARIRWRQNYQIVLILIEADLGAAVNPNL